MSKILFVAPHPDDETLGCGGTILRRKHEGHSLFWLIVSQPSPELGWTKKQISDREVEIKKVGQKLGFSETINLEFPSVKIDTIPMSVIINKISKTLKRIEPEIIYIPFLNDVHTDHQIINKAFQAYN